jgi:hypothetical protein
MEWNGRMDGWMTIVTDNNYDGDGWQLWWQQTTTNDDGVAERSTSTNSGADLVL